MGEKLFSPENLLEGRMDVTAIQCMPSNFSFFKERTAYLSFLIYLLMLYHSGICFALLWL